MPALEDFFWLEGPPRLAVTRRAARAAGGGGALLLHGIGGNRRNWAADLEALSARREVLAPDLRGYGDSEAHPPGAPLRFDDLVEDALRTMATARAPVHLLGLSMGGLIAQAVAARAPGLVRSLVLVACRPGDAPVLPGERGDAFLRDRLGPIERGGAEELAATLVPSLAGPEASPSARAALRDSILRLRVPDYVAVLRARAAMEPVADPAGLRMPTLVMGGLGDRLAPPAQMEALAAAIPGARLVLIAGAGHLVNLEAPAAFGATVTQFWNEVDA